MEALEFKPISKVALYLCKRPGRMPLELIKFRATTTHLKKKKLRKCNSCVGRWLDDDGRSLILGLHDTCPSVGQTKRVEASFETCSLHPKRQRWRLHGGHNREKLLELLKVQKLKKQKAKSKNQPPTRSSDSDTSSMLLCKYANSRSMRFNFFLYFFFIFWVRAHAQPTWKAA